jgi:hypothetical protein
MGLADLRPLPIPLLVRYKLIDSCSLAGPVRPVVCRGYYHGARARARASSLKNTKAGKKRKGKRKRNEERKGEVKVAGERAGVISRRTPERN